MRVGEIIAKRPLMESAFPFELEVDGTGDRMLWKNGFHFDDKAGIIDGLFSAMCPGNADCINIYDSSGFVCAKITLDNSYMEDWRHLEGLPALSQWLKNHDIPAFRNMHKKIDDIHEKVKKRRLKYAVDRITKFIAVIERNSEYDFELVIENLDQPLSEKLSRFHGSISRLRTSG